MTWHVRSLRSERGPVTAAIVIVIVHGTYAHTALEFTQA